MTSYDPTESLSNRLAVGWDYLNFESEEWEPFGYLRNTGGFFSSETQVREKLSVDYTGSVRNQVSDQVISTFSWGGQIFRDRARRKRASTENFAGPGTPTLTSGGGTTGLDDNTLGVTNAGFFFQEVLGFQDRLFVTGGLRVDGNSAFGDDFGLQVYPKVSVSYILSDLGFWPTGWFDTFKVRGALGESGKAPGAFDELRTWQPAVGDEGIAGFTPNNVGNRDVGPERTQEIEVGFDASFLTGRLGLEATYYNTSTTDALVPVTLPVSLGFLSTVARNVGELSGEGLEFQIRAMPYRSDNFEWRVGGNFGFNSTNAVELEDQEIFGDNKAGIREGFAVPSYFGTKVTNPNEFADPELETDTFLGNTNPTRIIGLSTSFTVSRRLTVDALFEHQGGFSLPNFTGYQNSRRGVWQPCFEVQEALVAQNAGDESLVADFTALERARCRMNGIGGNNSDFWVEEADFWKLRNVAVTYEIPEAWLGQIATRARVTLSGTNLFLWTDYSGNDPELEDFRDRAEGGIFDGNGDFGRREYYNIPAPRTFLLSFRFTF